MNLAWLWLPYLAVAAFAGRRIYPVITDKDPPDERADRIGCQLMSLVAGCVWPLLLVLAVVFYRAPKGRGELEAERSAFEDRTRELERENAALRAGQERRG